MTSFGPPRRASMTPSRETPRRSSFLNSNKQSLNVPKSLSKIFDSEKKRSSMTYSGTIDDLTSDLTRVKSELQVKQEEEEYKRQEYNNNKLILQDVYDQMITIRTTIGKTKSIIDEIAFELIANDSMAQDQDDPMVLANAIIIKDKLDNKSRLYYEIEKKELKLNELRKTINHQSDLLTTITASNNNSVNNNTTKTPDASIRRISTSTTSWSSDNAAELRKSLVNLTKELESHEEEYVMKKTVYDEIERELSVLLHPNTNKPSPNLITIATASPIPTTIQSDITINDVLNGKAKVIRHENESSTDYLTRLHRRLDSLLLLETQLKEQVDKKSEQVSKSRDLFREVEVERLRLELELSSIERRINDYENNELIGAIEEAGIRNKNISSVRRSLAIPASTNKTEFDVNKIEAVTDMLRNDLMGIDGYLDITKSAKTLDLATPPSSPGKSEYPTPKTNIEDKSESLLRKERHAAVVSIVGRLEQLAGQIENSSQVVITTSPTRTSASKTTLLDILQRQQKEIDALKESKQVPKAQQIKSNAKLGRDTFATALVDNNNNSSEIRGRSRERSITVKSHIKSFTASPTRKRMSIMKSPATTRSLSRTGTRQGITDDATLANDATLTIGMLRDRLQICHDKLEEMKELEHLDPNTGIALDNDGKSLAKLEVTIISAKSLPEMKKITKSADPYVEISLGPGSHDALEENDLNISCMAVTGENFPVSFANNRDNICQTTVKPRTLYPEWREFFVLHNITDLSQCVYFTLIDSSKMGGKHDEVIGHCSLQLIDLLDQHKKKVILFLQAPEIRKMSSCKMANDCSLLLEVRLFYSKRKYWENRISEVDRALEKKMKEMNVTPSKISSISTSASSAATESTINHIGPLVMDANSVEADKSSVVVPKVNKPFNRRATWSNNADSTSSSINRITPNATRHITRNSIVGLQESENTSSLFRSPLDPVVKLKEKRDNPINNSKVSQRRASSANSFELRKRSSMPTASISTPLTNTETRKQDKNIESSTSLSRVLTTEDIIRMRDANKKKQLNQEQVDTKPAVKRSKSVDSKVSSSASSFETYGRRLKGHSSVAASTASSKAKTVKLIIKTEKPKPKNNNVFAGTRPSSSSRRNEPNMSIFRGSSYSASASINIVSPIKKLLPRGEKRKPIAFGSVNRFK